MKKNMKWCRKAAAAGLAAAMVFSLVACGNDSTGATDKKTETQQAANIDNMAVEEVMKTANEKLATASSMSYDMTMDMEISIQEEKIATKAIGVADYIFDPMQMRIDMTVDMGELGSVRNEMYMQKEGDQYVMYTGIDAGTGTATWQKQPVMEAALAEYDAKSSLEQYLSGGENFQKIGTEKIGETEAIRYDGVISKEEMSQVLQASGVLNQLSGFGLSDADIDSFTDNLDELQIRLWISKTDVMPLKYEMDLTEVMQNLLKNIGDETVEVEVNKVLTSMTVRSINGVKSIEIPAEALAA